MSITLNGTTQFAGRATVPSQTDYVIAGWYRRTSDSGATEAWVSLDDGANFFNAATVQIGSGDAMTGYQGNGGVLAPNVGPTVVNTWYWVEMRQQAGTFSVRHMVNGGTAWAATQSVTAAAVAATQLSIGANYAPGAPSAFAPMTCALMKIWSGTLPTDAQVLAERTSTTVTNTAGLWASYEFASGALGTDSSGNARTLTLTAAPTFSADTPSDLGAPPATPTVSGILPTSGPIGTTVTVTGTNLSGVSAVSINGTAGTGVASNTATGFTFVVGSGTTTGALALTATAGSLTGGPTFTVTAAPVLTSLEITNPNVDYTLGVLLDPITVRAVDQFGATFLGSIADATVSALSLGVTVEGTLTEPFVSGIATFDNLTPVAVAPAGSFTQFYTTLLAHAGLAA